MANPLTRGGGDLPPTIGEADLIERCHRLNFGWKWMKNSRWHYVEPATKDQDARIMIVDGISATEVWTVLERGRIEYAKWPADKLAKIQRHARWLMKRGMIDHQAIAAE